MISTSEMVGTSASRRASLMLFIRLFTAACRRSELLVMLSSPASAPPQAPTGRTVARMVSSSVMMVLGLPVM